MKDLLLAPALARRAACGLLALVFAVAPASAAPSSSERTAAEVLYEEGKKLFGGGQVAEACSKFEESNRLDPGVGTLLFLGACYEKLGKTASAWITFREAAGLAHAARQADREKKAIELAAAIEPRLIKLQLLVPAEHDLPGLTIKRDGVVVSRSLWGSSVPIDPGTFSVEVSAPSRRSVTLALKAEKSGQLITLPIPLLEPSQAPTASSSPAPPAASVAPTAASSAPRLAASLPETTPQRSSLVPVALAVGGLGVISAGIGAFLGFRAVDQWDRSRPLCPGDVCNREGYDLANAASRSGNLSTIFLSLGAVGVGAGVTLWLLEPRNPSAARRSRSFSVGASGSGLFARGSW